MQDQRAGVRVGNNYGVDYSWMVSDTGTDIIAELTEAFGAAGWHGCSLSV